MGRLIRYIITSRGHETTSVPDISPGQAVPSSRNPAPNEIRMKDVLFQNSQRHKGRKTATALCPTASFRRAASPRGILHLIKFGIRNSCTKQKSWHDFAREERPKQTTSVARVCEGVFMPKRNEGIKTPEAALKSLALSQL